MISTSDTHFWDAWKVNWIYFIWILLCVIETVRGNCEKTVEAPGPRCVKSRVSQHRRPSTGDTYDSAIQHVFTHMWETGHKVAITDFRVLDKEEDWHKRGVKEAIWERIKEPSLNKKGGLRFNLSHTWDRPLQQFSHSFLWQLQQHHYTSFTWWSP